jgi:hypothetical protein
MRWQAYVAAVMLSGCQAIQAFDPITVTSETGFVNMWKHYVHCQSSTNVDQIWQDAQQLNKTVRLMAQAARTAQLLPDTIEQMMAEPPPRLAVDPKAMAVACTLLAGQAAQNAGRARFAAELFGLVLSNFTQPRYAYYQTQAQMGLDQIEGDADDRIMMATTPYIPQSRDME